MFEGYRRAKELTQNLTDAGCSEEMIAGLLSCLRSGDQSGGLSRLAQRRAELLDEIHQEPACIAFPDRLISEVREHEPFKNSSRSLLRNSFAALEKT